MKKKRFNMWKYALIMIILAIILAPIYWMVNASMMDNATLFSRPPQFNIFEGSLNSYKQLVTLPKYVRFFMNSMFVSGCTVLLSMVVSLFAGYSLSRYRFPGKELIRGSILAVQMFPTVAILISLYTVFSSLKLINTYMGLILADTMLSLPLSVMLLTSFFDTIPRDLDEAARIDGCSRLGTLFRVVMPCLKPGLVAVAIYSFLQSWDDYLFGMIIMTEDATRTLPVGIAQSFIGEYAFNYSGMMSLSVITSLPVMILFIFLQKHMISGLTGGAVKG